MLAGSGRSYMRHAAWMALLTGLAISLAVFGFNMLGDALRDALDPRLRGTSPARERTLQTRAPARLARGAAAFLLV